MLCIDFLIFFLIGLYMDKVIPSEFGQRLNPCFLCMPSYYSCCRSSRHRPAVAEGDAGAQLLEEEGDQFEIA